MKNQDPAETFARRLREERERAGLSQVEFARRLSAVLAREFDPSSLTRVEQQKRGVKLDEAVRIAEVLGVPLANLLRDSSLAEDELAQLREDHVMASWRADQAMASLEEAQAAVAQIERTIAELEASRGH